MAGTAEPAPGAVQWPFVGLAVLLVLLILTTPGLLRLGTPGAVSPTTSAVLVVDRPPASNATHFYLEGVATTRYTHLSLALLRLPSWPVGAAAANLSFRSWTNVSDALVVGVVSGENPVAVNVSAELVDASGAVAIYYGVYAFNVTGGSILIQALTPGLDPGTPSLTVANLPEPLPLLEVTSRT